VLCALPTKHNEEKHTDGVMLSAYQTERKMHADEDGKARFAAEQRNLARTQKTGKWKEII
jgi:hypothetical protein